jgi:arylsulfatase A-like enzyme
MQSRGNTISVNDLIIYIMTGTGSTGFPARNSQFVWRYFVLWAAAFAAPLTIRIMLVAEMGLSPALNDVSGILSDLGSAFFVALILSGLARLTRGTALVFILVWAQANYLIYEYVRTIGALPLLSDARYLADETFIFGSILAVSRPILLGVILATTMLLFWLSVRRIRGPFLTSVLAVLSVLFFLGTFLLPGTVQVAQWRQTNFIQENILSLVNPVITAEDNSSKIHLAERYFQPDLSGDRFVPEAPDNVNVILILLESVSSTYLPTISQECLRAPTVKMPLLDKISQKAVTFQTFISHQQGTDRGEYSILCGDYPKLLFEQSKMTDIAMETIEAPRCLPEILRDSGYETVYMQAAPLTFMFKDRFMSKAGFTQTYDDEWFTGDRIKTGWGVDDHVFFTQAFQKVQQLAEGPRPFFLTLLTVGTHHPFHVPDTFTENRDAPPFQRAIAYLDMSIDSFMKKLEDSGIMENTLVILTSDESAGFRQFTDLMTGRLSHNMGVMSLFVPSVNPDIIAEPYVQSDIALSILDYLGLGDSAPHFVGRSMFRHYRQPRISVFAGGPRRTLGIVDTKKQVSLCSSDMADCVSYSSDDRGCLTRIDSPPDPLVRQQTLAIVDRSSLKTYVDEKEQHYNLVSKTEMTVNERYRALFASQLVVPAGSNIEVSLEVRLHGDKGKAFFFHRLCQFYGTGCTSFYERTFVLKPGYRLVLNYVYPSEKAVDRMLGHSIVWTDKENAGNLTMEFVRGEIMIRPVQSGTGSSLRVKRLELDRIKKGMELFDQGIVHMRKHEYEEAVKAFRSVLEINPDYGAASVNLGYSLLDMGQPEKAVAAFKDTVKHWPEEHNAVFGLALSYQTMNRKEQAAQTWRLYLQQAPESRWKESAKQHLQRLQQEK